MKALLAALFLGWAGLVQAEEATPVRPYPFDFCIVQGEKFEEFKEPYVIVHEGQQYKVCCKDCVADFKKDPAHYAEKLRLLLKEKASRE